MKFINPLRLGSIFLIVFLCNSAFADTAQMNATLARISAVLNQINPLINLAQSQQNPNARVQFQFDQLRSDIANIQSGIAQAVNHVSIQPRVVQPLSGDYLPDLPKPQSMIKNKNEESGS